MSPAAAHISATFRASVSPVMGPPPVPKQPQSMLMRRKYAEATATVLHQTIAGTDREPSGVFHLTAQGVTTWCRFAQHALNQLGLGTRIVPIPAAEYPTAALRPSNSSLATDKLRSTFEIVLPGWEVALDQVLLELDVKS